MIQDELREIFNTLKKLKIDATPENVSIMTGVYEMLKQIYAELDEKEGDTCDGGAQADPE